MYRNLQCKLCNFILNFIFHRGITLIKQPYTSLNGIEANFTRLYGTASCGQLERYANAFNKFKSIYKENGAYIASSSGRVEVLGNHTDHNGGKVICASISLDSLAMFMPTNDNVIYVSSEGYKDFKIDIDKIEKKVESSSRALVAGVVYAIKQRGYNVGGFKVYVTSNVIGGAGISSSASFEVLIAEIINFLYNDGKLTNEEKSYIAQYAEREFFGKPCGLLDQSAIAYGGLNKIDFSNPNKINVTTIDNKLKDFTFVLINTGGSHADLTDEYASIPAEMKAVAKACDKDLLINLSEEEFYNSISKISGKVSDRAVCRAIHFYQENNRVDLAGEALANGDFSKFISQINASGVSSLCKLQNCYVSGKTEQLIPKALAITERYIANGGVRIHGGGFAGCVLCVVENKYLDAFIADMKNFYGANRIIPLSVRDCGAIVL